MSMRQKMAKYSPDIKRQIRTAALRGLMDERGGLLGTAKIFGYVCNIRDENDADFPDTVDVQEYNYNEDEDGMNAGFHEGVRLSAIQNNKTGYKIVPQLFSDVMIIQDPTDLTEYVIMYSHVQLVQMKTWEKVTIEVAEHEDFQESGDGLADDYDEVKETGNTSTTEYTKDHIDHKVVSDDDKSSEIEQTSKQITQTVVGDKTTTTTQDGGTYNIKADKSTFELDGTLAKVNGEDTEAVRYKELKAWLEKLCKFIQTGTCVNGSPISTASQIGTMPSEIPNFQSQKVKLS